jgi:hypothetical protein
MRRFHGFTASLALALGLAALTGTATAASGNGNGNAPAAAPAAAAPGNSGAAPGQVKQAQPAAQPAAQPQPAAKTSSPGQQKQAAKAASSSSQAGVKPSSTTAHWTKTKVGATPDVSKRYGNGKTAAQIAASRGAPADTKLTGPGNSQPHKVTACGKPANKSGGVDVHAVKSYTTNCTTLSAAPAGSTESSSRVNAGGTSAGGVNAGLVSPLGAGGVAGTSATSPAAGGVLGAQATLASPKPAGHGVLGAVGRVAGGKLPFTGLQLWIAVLIAAVLVAGGVFVRRHGRGTARI